MVLDYATVAFVMIFIAKRFNSKLIFYCCGIYLNSEGNGFFGVFI